MNIALMIFIFLYWGNLEFQHIKWIFWTLLSCKSCRLVEGWVVRDLLYSKLLINYQFEGRNIGKAENLLNRGSLYLGANYQTKHQSLYKVSCSVMFSSWGSFWVWKLSFSFSQFQSSLSPLTLSMAFRMLCTIFLRLYFPTNVTPEQCLLQVTNHL